MQEGITKTVIDTSLRISQSFGMLTADEIREELIRQIDCGKVRQVDVARHLKIEPPRVKEMHKRTRRVQQEEMKPLAEFLGINDEVAETNADARVRKETIRLALDAGLQSLTKPQATEDDLPLLAHVVSEVLIHVAKNPASEHSESFPKEVVAIAGVAIRHYKPPPEKAA